VCIPGGVASTEIGKPDISSLDVSEWKKCVCEVFEEFDYDDEVDDDDECTQGKLNVMEYNMLRQSISAIAEDAGKKSQRKGKKNGASKVSVIYIMKHNPFKDFADEFSDFVVDAQNSALGQPELCEKDATEQPVPMLEVQEENGGDAEDEDSAEEPRVAAADSGADGTPLASHNMETWSDARMKPDLLNDADYDDDGDNEEIEETEENDDIEETGYESQMAPRGKRGKPTQATQLKKASSELRDTVATIDDPLQNALAATDEVAKSVMTGMHASSRAVKGSAVSSKKRAPQKENENNGTADRATSSRAGGEAPEKKAVGILAGARPSSKADTVNFESESDSPDDDAQGTRIALPTGNTQPIPKFDHKGSPEKPRNGKRKKWTAEEEQFIMDGVERYGKGKWSEIKLEYFKHSKRSAVDIKDKFRNIEKKMPK
jgi:telomeric repeat-binding factor 2